MIQFAPLIMVIPLPTVIAQKPLPREKKLALGPHLLLIILLLEKITTVAFHVPLMMVIHLQKVIA